MEYKEIKQLVDDMGNSKIDELKIEFPDGTKISMKKNVDKIPNSLCVNENMASLNNCSSQNENNMQDNNKCVQNFKEIKSPMVGTFYSKSSPSAKPFVKVGDKVKKGDVVCIVEAMKLMNEIESEFDGEIVEICKNDEDMCEYGDCLFKVK